ncbi:nitrilase family protein [Caulobacter segnis]|jgi:predicted amidohydrolase|uniref:nitrilase family protein n=1 Tax=Caulobacter segnis TaxID=88688 RepID=UPI001CBDC7FD|nr:nitrilase family protein [Caulobacter segnis]UAL10014.1 nitrilase family protein [Caulobacter segnis]
MSTLRAAVVQFQHLPGDKAANLATLTGFVERAAADGVKILAFPEMCLTGYWHCVGLPRDGWLALAEPVPNGPSSLALAALARRHDMVIGSGLIERGEDGRIFNTYVVALPDGRVERHRKLHAFESEHVSSGDAFTVFDTPFGVRVGVLICWDNNLVENVRATALLGADILLSPHQTGGTASRSPHAMGVVDVALWRDREANPEALRAAFQGDKGRGWLLRWLPARAHDNGLFVLFANGVGEDAGEVRTGNAMILDPYGRVVAETDAIEDALVVADLDLDLLPLATGRRWIRGRRPELYGLLTERRGDELSPLEARFSTAPTISRSAGTPPD